MSTARKKAAVIGAVAPAVRYRMQQVRRTGTQPELAVGSLLRELGVRYRREVKSLPGKPDLANQRAGWVILVHGCFWHGHPNCRRARLPKTNVAFWEARLATNRARDSRNEVALAAMGLRVTIVWSCELSDPDLLRRKLARAVAEPLERDLEKLPKRPVG